MVLQGERVLLRPLTRGDLDEVEAWTPFTDPLYLAWNTYPWHRMGKDLWYELEATDPAVERYAIVDREGRVIGVLGLVDVDGTRSPVLSIFLGAEFSGQGLGTDALRTLLRHVFQERGQAAVRLQVAATNGRARRAYEKCGFHVTGERYRPPESGDPLAYLGDPRYQHLRRYVRQEGERTYLLFYDMQITAAEWWASQGTEGPEGIR